MATSYTIEIGYNSGYSCSLSRDQMWEELKKEAMEICDNPHKIIEEARKFNAPEHCKNGPDCCTLSQMVVRYYERSDQTVTFDENHQHIRQSATGDREVKEHVRRAFCRLVIYAMHRKGIEVNLRVS